MLSEDATVTDFCDISEDFTWVFDYVKTNANSSARVSKPKAITIQKRSVLYFGTDLF